MKCFAVIALLIAVSQSALILSADTHATLQEMCGNLVDNPMLDKVDASTKAKLIPHLATVCQIYDRHYLSGTGQIHKRGILDGLGSLMGKDSKLGALLKAAEALNKAKGVFDEIKKVAPAVHNHVQGGIKDVHDSFQDLIDSITGEFMDKTTTAKP